MKKTLHLIFIITLLVVLVLGYLYASKPTIKEYVSENISQLSQNKEILGGKFYITDIKVDGDSGTVWYEDGHIALVADFTYITKTFLAPEIGVFINRP
jgi:hypothetical protein